jgi:CHASE2 domain-containing sensor protein
MQISFDEKVVHPATLATAVDWRHYAEIVGRQIGALPGNGYLGTPREVTGSTLVFLYAASAVLGLTLWRRQPARHGRESAWLVALLATYLVRFLLFPQLWDRFFAPFYALVPLCLLTMLVRELAARRAPAV